MFYLNISEKERPKHSLREVTKLIASLYQISYLLEYRKIIQPLYNTRKTIFMTLQIKFPFKRKACQVYEGGCSRQVSTAVSLVVWWTGGCYCKVVAIDRKVQLYLWQYGRQVDVIEMWLLLTGKYSCFSGSIVDRWVLL